MQLMTVGCIDGRMPVDSRNLSPLTPAFLRFTVFRSGDEEEDSGIDAIVSVVVKMIGRRNHDGCWLVVADAVTAPSHLVAIVLDDIVRARGHPIIEKDSTCVINIIIIAAAVMVAALLLMMVLSSKRCGSSHSLSLVHATAVGTLSLLSAHAHGYG